MTLRTMVLDAQYCVGAGVEFLRQALTLDPENEGYRKDFLSLTKVPHFNTVL